MRMKNISCTLAFVLTAALPAAGDMVGRIAGAVPTDAGPEAIAKATSTQSLGSRGTVTPSATLFGGFETRSGADVYILVRGNSLGTLGVTQNYLDLPRVRVYNASGQDIFIDVNGVGGFNGCMSGSVYTDPVVNYYANVRHQAAHQYDACVAYHFPAGVYTFSVTPTIPGVTTPSGTSPSVPSSGEVLFEVTLAP